MLPHPLLAVALQVVSLQDSNAGLKQHLDEMRGSLTTLQDQLRRSIAEAQQWHSEKAELEAELEGMRQRAKQEETNGRRLREQLSAAQAAARKAEDERNEINARARSLEDTLASHAQNMYAAGAVNGH